MTKKPVECDQKCGLAFHKHADERIGNGCCSAAEMGVLEITVCPTDVQVQGGEYGQVHGVSKSLVVQYAGRFGTGLVVVCVVVDIGAHSF